MVVQHPVVLAGNQVGELFYRGGTRIREFRGLLGDDPFAPEEWLGSTVSLRGTADIGLTTLPDGSVLRDRIAEDPIAWLGPDHVERWGVDPMLLTKLLHAGERLPVHAHPDDTWAKRHLGLPHGKAEAWYVLEGGAVHLGLRQPVSAQDLTTLIAEGRDGELVDLLHERTVAPGDTVYVPAGLLHAIGQDVFVVEVQQASDVSILLETSRFELPAAFVPFLGVGASTALAAVETEARTAAELDRLFTSRQSGQLLVDEAEEHFRLARAVLPAVVQQGFAVVIGLSGSGGVTDSHGQHVPITRGTALLVPYGAGKLQVDGEIELIICRPPSISPCRPEK